MRLLLAQQPNRLLTHLWIESCALYHDAIFSRNRAPGNSGAIQMLRLRKVYGYREV